MEPLKSSLSEPFPGNSQREREQAEKTPPPKPVLSAQTTVKKESPFLTFYRAVFSGTIQDVKSSLFNRMVNVAKDTIYNTFVGFLDDYIYNGQSQTRSSLTRSSLTNPDRYWTSGGKSLTPATRGGYACPTVIYHSRMDAEEVLKAMLAYFGDYGNVPVSLYLDYSGKTFEYTDNDWGWRSLDGVTPKPVSGGGYILTLPRPESLK